MSLQKNVVTLASRGVKFRDLEVIFISYVHLEVTVERVLLLEADNKA